MDEDSTLPSSLVRGRTDASSAFRQFHPFEQRGDEAGICNAIIDILDLVECGAISEFDRAMDVADTVLNRCVPVRDSVLVGVCASSCSSSVHSPDCSSPARNQVCEIPCGEDGLPSEETISFLFDDVSHEVVTSRAENEPAYKRLAALRERVVARLNLPNG